MTLHDFQRQFVDGLLYQQDVAILQSIAQSNARSAQDLLGIYRDSVYGGLSKALTSIYPVCCKLVGESFFNAMTTRYISQQPSTSPDLNDYGRELADFIEDFAPTAALPYLADVARLEWNWHRVFNAAASTPLNLQQLAQIPQEQRQHIVFSLASSAMLLRSDYPVHHIWRINQDDYAGDECVNLDEGGDTLLIWREGLTMRIDTIADAQWLLLSRVDQGIPFGQLCQELSQHYPASDIGELLNMAIRQGWLTSFYIEL